jgi:hypothetical protein
MPPKKAASKKRMRSRIDDDFDLDPSDSYSDPDSDVYYASRAAAASSVVVKDDWVTAIDQKSRNSTHIATTSSLRGMLESASENFSDIVFECAAERAAGAELVEVDRDSKAKRSKTSAAASSSSSSSSGALSLDSNPTSLATSGRNRIHAHRCILSASSPYFRTLFAGAWRDVSDGRIFAKQGARAIRRMLDFIYTGEMTAAQALQLPLEDLAELHEASAEYQIEALRAMTEAALAQSVTASNVVHMLGLASLHDGTSCMLAAVASSTQAGATCSSPASSSSSSSSSLSSLAPCTLMNACIAVLKGDLALLISEGLADFLAAQPKLRASLQAALSKKA